MYGKASSGCGNVPTEPKPFFTFSPNIGVIDASMAQIALWQLEPSGLRPHVSNERTVMKTATFDFETVDGPNSANSILQPSTKEERPEG